MKSIKMIKMLLLSRFIAADHVLVSGDPGADTGEETKLTWTISEPFITAYNQVNKTREYAQRQS